MIAVLYLAYNLAVVQNQFWCPCHHWHAGNIIGNRARDQKKQNSTMYFLNPKIGFQN